MIGQEIKNIYDVAATDGTRNAARLASFFVLMGAASSLPIPGQRRETEPLTEETEGEPLEEVLKEQAMWLENSETRCCISQMRGAALHQGACEDPWNPIGLK